LLKNLLNLIIKIISTTDEYAIDRNNTLTFVKKIYKRICVYIIKEYEKEFKRQHKNKEDQFKKFDQKKQIVDRPLCEMF
jgi:hypothetical protein